MPAMATISDSDHTIIKEGDRVILKKAKSMSCVQVVAKKKYNLEKTWFCLDGAIGMQYGTTFEPKGNTVLAVTPDDQEDMLADVEVDRDNRNLIDTSDNQKLVHEDIEQMKKDGVSGQNIIEQLVENSATFKVKTEYAQEKYIRRKKKKHFRQFQVLRPCTRLLAEMYFNRGPSKICNLRADSLAQMLTLGNVHAHNKMLVFETCLGLVTGSVVERLGGFGEVVQVHTGEIAAKTAVEQFNFPDSYWKKLHYYPVRKLSLLKQQNVTEADFNFYQERQGRDAAVEQEPAGDIKEVGLGKDCEEENEDGAEEMDVEGANDGEESREKKDDGPPCKKSRVETSSETPCAEVTEEEKKKEEDFKLYKQRSQDRKQRRFDRLEKAHQTLKAGEFDGLLVACRVYPTPVLLELLNYVSPSRPIVIFSQFKEPLYDCYMKLCNTKKVVNLRMTETWWRNYQVLPNRTHPEIKMNNYSGYLLTGMTVENK